MQVKKYRLPHSPDAIKDKDSRAKKYVAQFGKLAVELDALPPNILQDIVRSSIEANLDMEEFKRQLDKQKEERNLLQRLRGFVTTEIHAQWRALKE